MIRQKATILAVHPLYTELHFLEVFLRLLVPCMICEHAVETWAKGSSIKPLAVHDLCHTHSLASLQWSGLFDRWMLLLTEGCLQCQKWSHYKGRAAFYMPICVKKKRNSQASAEQGFSTASQHSRHVHCMSCLCLPTSSYPTFFASAKPIFKTECTNW